MMNYLEKKYGRNIISQRVIESNKKPQKTIQLKLKTLIILLITVLIMGFIVGSVIVNINSKDNQCLNKLKGGDIDG